MNFYSLIFALVIGGILAAAAWAIDWGAARNNHWSPAKRRVARWFFYPLAAVAGICSYLADSGVRNTTLFEVAGAWEETGARVWVVEIEHPGVEHDILVDPDLPWPESARDPISLRVRFGPEGGEPLLDTVSSFEVRRRSKSSRRGWSAMSWSITPRAAGPHLFKVTAVESTPPRLHLRIADPEKRDGKRAPGY